MAAFAGQDSADFWLVSLPNGRATPRQTWAELTQAVASTGGGGSMGFGSSSALSAAYKFEFPKLLVGTLDSLMSLSDKLEKLDMTVKGVVMQIARKHGELLKAQGQLSGTDEGTNKADFIKVNDITIEQYVQKWRWDAAKYPPKRPLPELTQLIQTNVAKIEAELRRVVAKYTEGKASLAQVMRKKGGNLNTADLSALITPALVKAAGATFVNTEYLKTLVVAVPAQSKEVWLASYEGLDAESVPYGEGQDRYARMGSPVVPGSAVLLDEDRDVCLFTVTVLRKFIDSFSFAAREKRFVVREFTYDGGKSASASREEQAKLEVAHTKSEMMALRWTTVHFGESFIAWTHIKAIRVFVESVLRYGLPINFTSALLRPDHSNSSAAGQMRRKLKDLFAQLAEGDGTSVDEFEDMADEEYHPYVSIPFSPLAAKH